MTSSMPLGNRTRIDIRAIERELSTLWKHIAETYRNGDQPAVTRVCVLNLLVCVSNSALADRMTDVIAQLTTRHPNRAIMITAQPDAPDELLDGWAQAHCQTPGAGRQQVCCEQISIDARGPAVARVPGTVLPLLVPDVPAMLWWPHGTPFDHPLFDRLGSMVDRIIVDSTTFAAPEQGLHHIAALQSQALTISDLAWGRLTPWRELFAQFFDAPAMLGYLNQLTHITIEHKSEDRTPAARGQALLLVGWLISRLNWSQRGETRRQNGTTLLQFERQNGAPISVELRPAAIGDEVLGRLASFTAEAPDARFFVARSSEQHSAITRAEIKGMETLQRTVRLEYLDEAGLLAEELRLLGRDRGYEGALHAAVALGA